MPDNRPALQPPADLAAPTALPASVLSRPLTWLVPALLLAGLAWSLQPGHDAAAMLRLNHALLLSALPAGVHPPLMGWQDAAPPTVALAALWSSLSVLGLGLSALLLMLADTRRMAPRAAAFFLCFILAGAATHAIKRAVDEPRPAAVLVAQGLQVVGDPLRTKSMPSGHSVTAYAVAALLLLAPGARRGLGWSALVLAAASSLLLARIGVGAHWPSDVLAGAALGWLCGAACVWIAWRTGLAGWFASHRGLWLLALVRAGGGVALCTMDTGYPLGRPLQWTLGAVSVLGGLWDLHRLLRAPAATGPEGAA